MFNDKDLTSVDLVNIIGAYPGDTSFVRALDSEFKDSTEEKYCNKMVDAFIDVLENGTDAEKAKAMEVLCKQIYGATAEGNGTADKFMEVLFDKLDGKDQILNDIYKNYGTVNSGRSLTDDIKKDYKNVLGFLNGTGKEYIKQIEEAIERTSRK